MTLNLAQRSFKVMHFGGNRKPVYDFIYRQLIVTFALSSTVSEILPVLIGRVSNVTLCPQVPNISLALIHFR